MGDRRRGVGRRFGLEGLVFDPRYKVHGLRIASRVLGLRLGDSFSVLRIGISGVRQRFVDSVTHYRDPPEHNHDFDHPPYELQRSKP